ncbi:MAG: hypothetical protein RB296_01155 [Acidobacteriota bacterium]|jgi:hypothetical protein|nr:hypothetical protein [Acidobacteriota bacterium]
MKKRISEEYFIDSDERQFFLAKHSGAGPNGKPKVERLMNYRYLEDLLKAMFDQQIRIAFHESKGSLEVFVQKIEESKEWFQSLVDAAGFIVMVKVQTKEPCRRPSEAVQGEISPSPVC